MTKSDYLKLIEEIEKHDRLYYIEARPIIADYEYDQLARRLEEIEKLHPEWITAFSPTQKVGGAPLKEFQQKAHRSAMLSLANSYSEQEIEDFIKRVLKNVGQEELCFSAELKMDGVAVSILYEKGVYSQALTRGDGYKGDDITEGAKTIASLPLRLSMEHPPEQLEVRGEVYLPLSSFHLANQKKEEEGEAPWANPRNAAAGSLKLLDPKEVRRRSSCSLHLSLGQRTATSPED